MMSSMNATVRPFFDGGATQQVDDILKWMDALASRECSTDEFLHEVLEREQDDPDLPREVLALLDQYYRCKKIRHDVFVSLKARLQKESLYIGSGGSVAAPKLVVEEPYLAPDAPDAPTIATVPPAPPPSDLPLVAVEPVRRANPFEPVQPASTEPALEPAVAVALASPAAAPEPVMSAAPVPLTEIPAMSADPATPAVEPAPTVTAPPSLRTPAPGAGPRADDLLRGRYRITEILRRDLSGVLVEAVDEVRADVPRGGPGHGPAADRKQGSAQPRTAEACLPAAVPFASLHPARIRCRRGSWRAVRHDGIPVGDVAGAVHLRQWRYPPRRRHGHDHHPRSRQRAGLCPCARRRAR